jgi:GMP synthase (glutamine-hydrolysing)
MKHRDCVVILNFGSQYSQSILRRCRELGVYSLLVPYSINVESLKEMNPKGIILSGGPFSVYSQNSLHTTAEFWEYCIKNSIPVFAICYGMQEMVRFFGGEVSLAKKGEYGWVNLYIKTLKNSSGEDYVDPIFKNIKNDTTEIWMSHRDSITRMPDNFVCSAFTEDTQIAAIFDASRKLYGVQFHPEVTHTKDGRIMFENFLSMLNLQPEAEWSMSSFSKNAKSELRERIGKRHVIGALSGGVDSTVAAALIHESVGSQFHGFIVDTGLLRLNEGAKVVACLKKYVEFSCINVIIPHSTVLACVFC